MSERQSDRVELFQGALTYEDPRFAGFDAAVLMEVVEHVDPPRLDALERVVFGDAASATSTRPSATQPKWRYSAVTDAIEPVQVTVPAMGLVVLVGISGSGKSTFASTHFKPTEVVSSDFCRGLVADDENDQSATPDAFDVATTSWAPGYGVACSRSSTATNVQQQARASLVKLARSHDVLVDAIVLDVPESLAIERNKPRPDRDFGSHVVSRQHRDLKRSLRRLNKEGFRRVHILRGHEQIAAAEVTRERPWNDRRDIHGPFDIIGDIHGCASELRTLLTELGWQLEYGGDVAVGATHPEGRQAVFVGDLVDRGPDTPGCSGS